MKKMNKIEKSKTKIINSTKNLSDGNIRVIWFMGFINLEIKHVFSQIFFHFFISRLFNYRVNNREQILLSGNDFLLRNHSTKSSFRKINIKSCIWLRLCAIISCSDFSSKSRKFVIYIIVFSSRKIDIRNWNKKIKLPSGFGPNLDESKSSSLYKCYLKSIWCSGFVGYFVI